MLYRLGAPLPLNTIPEKEVVYEEIPDIPLPQTVSKKSFPVTAYEDVEATGLQAAGADSYHFTPCSAYGVLSSKTTHPEAAGTGLPATNSPAVTHLLYEDVEAAAGLH